MTYYVNVYQFHDGTQVVGSPTHSRAEADHVCGANRNMYSVRVCVLRVTPRVGARP